MRPPSLERIFWPAAAAMLAGMAWLQVSSMRLESQTFDEGFHLVAGFSYWKTGSYRLNAEHPPLSKLLCALPLLWTGAQMPADKEGWEQGDQVALSGPFLYANAVPADTLLLLGRSATVMMTLLLGLAIAWWTRRRFSAAAGLIALFLYCTDPNFIAHGRYITSDVPAALTIFLAAVTWVRYLETGMPGDLVRASLALGVALATKYSALYLIPLHAALYWLRREREPRRLGPVMAGAGALLVLLYLPDGLLSDRIPRYIAGMWRVLEHNQEGHVSYLLGEITNTGRWDYFPVAFAVKTPAATLALLAAALAVVAGLLRPLSAFGIALALYPVAYFGFCIVSRLNIGLRHLLPVYPFLFVLIGAATVHWWGRRWPRWTAAAVLLAASVQLWELRRIHPHYLAYFQVLAGGPENGHRLLLDSNLDWGQDAKKLSAWMDRNGLETVCASYFGTADLAYYRIPEGALWGRPAEELDCVAAVSANNLHELYAPPGSHAWLRGLRPFGHIGYSIFLYDLRKDRSAPLVP